MKIRKTISTLCAAAMLLSTCSFASAAETEPDSLSMYAGETIQVGITHVHEDGETTQQVIDVYIPEDATEEEGNEIIFQATLPAEIGLARAARSQYELLFVRSGAPGSDGFTISSSNGTSGSFQLRNDYSFLHFQFNGITAYSGASSVIATVLQNGKTSSANTSFGSNNSCEVFIVNGRNGITFNADDYLGFNCTVDTGYIKCQGLVISGII